MDDYRKYFSWVVKENYPIGFEDILKETEENYKIISFDTAFGKSSKNPLDKRLDVSAYFLALIKTLDKNRESFENIRKICLQITTVSAQPKNNIQEFFKRLLPKLIATWLGQILLRALDKRGRVNTNADGFVAHIITDKRETFGLGFGIDIIECGICKLFQKHDFSKYNPILCEVDEITTGLAGLQLIRKGTIATGAKSCDFRFKRRE